MDLAAQHLQAALRDFLMSPQFSNLNFDTSIPQFCTLIAKTLDVKRVGIWGIDLARTRLTRYALHHAGTVQLDADVTLDVQDMQSLLHAIAAGHTVNCSDAATCADLAPHYFPNNGVTALLALPISCCGRVSGVLMLEHVGSTRQWTDAEVDFATSFSGIISQAVAIKDHAPPAPDSMALERRTQFYTEHVADWYWETYAHFTLLNVTSGSTRTGHPLHALIGCKLWDIPGFMPVNFTWDDFRAQLEDKRNLDGIIFTSMPSERRQTMARSWRARSIIRTINS